MMLPLLLLLLKRATADDEATAYVERHGRLLLNLLLSTSLPHSVSGWAAVDRTFKPPARQPMHGAPSGPGRPTLRATSYSRTRARPHRPTPPLLYPRARRHVELYYKKNRHVELMLLHLILLLVPVMS